MLKFTKEVDAGINICAILAKNNNRQLQAEVLIAKSGLTKPFFLKIVYPLIKNNIISNSRGKDGGYRLKKKPADISIQSIVRCYGDVEIIDCMIEKRCRIRRNCEAISLFSAIRNNIINTLKRTTIKSLLSNSKRRVRISPR
ncbi:MAG: Rrf2 family transcriptional regulator [Candidatus Hydrogenedentota bacterium]